MPAQHVSGVEELLLGGEAVGAIQIEHDRRVVEKPRAALDLLCQLLLENRVAQHPCANHHHGEKRALNEIARHPKTGATGKMFDGHGLAPNPPCRNGFRLISRLGSFLG